MTCILRDFPVLSKWVVYWLCTSPRRCNLSALIFISLNFSFLFSACSICAGLKYYKSRIGSSHAQLFTKTEMPSNNFQMAETANLNYYVFTYICFGWDHLNRDQDKTRPEDVVRKTRPRLWAAKTKAGRDKIKNKTSTTKINLKHPCISKKS